MFKGSRQCLTKLVVNQKVNLPREKVAEVWSTLKQRSEDSTGDEWASVSGKAYWVRAINLLWVRG